MDAILWGGLVRMGQALFAAAPTLVIGWMVAAIFERILGREGTFRLFGGRTWKQIPYAWLLGMLLPVCSLGVIPVMVQMRRSGLSGGTILAFGLTAPLFNPISVLYGLTLADPTAIFVFCIGSLTIVTVLGTAWDRFFPNSWIEPEPLPKTPYGIKRVGAVLVSMCQQAWSSSSLYVGLAIVGVGLLSMFLPPTVLQHSASHNDPLAPVTMACVSTLAFVPPMVAIVQVASMFEHGNSIGAAFSLLVLGAGVNLGTIAWMVVHYRWKPTLVWSVLLLVVVLGISYAVDGPLYPKGVDAADHTHAFDHYCNPFIDGTPNLAASSWRLIQDTTETEELISIVAVAALLACGGMLMAFDRRSRLLSFLLREVPRDSSNTKGMKWDIVLPESVIAFTCFAGLIAASIGGCYMYYPPASEIKKGMSMINGAIHEAATRSDWDGVAYWIPLQEDAAHKLQVSGYLRRKPLTVYQQAKLKAFMFKLEMLEHAAEDKEIDEVKRWSREMAMSYLRLTRAI